MPHCSTVKSFDEITAALAEGAPFDPDCFFSVAARGYRDGLARMAAERPDYGRLDIWRFCAELLARDPHDVRAAWALIGQDVFTCPNALTETAWTALLALGEFDPVWLIDYAYWVQVTCGVPTAVPLGELLRRHQLLAAVRPALESLEVPWPVGWGADVRDAALYHASCDNERIR